MSVLTRFDRRIFSGILITFLFVSFMLFSARSLMNLTIRCSGTIGPSVTVTLPLHVEGKWIKDPYGNIVILRGVNKPGPVDHPSGLWDRNRTFDSTDVIHNLDAMKSWGMNVVRIFYPCDFWIDNTDNFRQNLKDVSNLAAEREMYVIYCGYQVINYPDGGGQDALPYPPYQVGSSNAGAENYIASEQDYIDMLVSIANELGTHVGYDNVIIELWNEPHGEGMTSWFDVCQQAIDAIRATGAENLIYIQWNWDLYWNGPTNHNSLNWIDQMGLVGSNIVYSTHIYMKQGGLGGFTEGPQTMEEARQRLTDCMMPWLDQVPIVIGEISGLISVPEQQNAWANVMEVLNQWDVGYLAWWWRHDGGHPLISNYYPDYTPTLNGEILRNAIATAG